MQQVRAIAAPLKIINKKIKNIFVSYIFAHIKHRRKKYFFTTVTTFHLRCIYFKRILNYLQGVREQRKYLHCLYIRDVKEECRKYPRRIWVHICDTYYLFLTISYINIYNPPWVLSNTFRMLKKIFYFYYLLFQSQKVSTLSMIHEESE